MPVVGLLYDAFLCALFSQTGSVNLTYWAIVAIEGTFLALALIYIWRFRLHRFWLIRACIGLGLVVIAYSVVGIVRGVFSAREARLLLNPLVWSALWLAIILRYGTEAYWKWLVGSIAVVVAVGIAEIAVLSEGFYYQYMHISGYYEEVKGFREVMEWPFHDGAMSRLPRSFEFAPGHRVFSVFLEPLTAGHFMASAGLIAVARRLVGGVKGGIVGGVALVSLITVLLTQTRSAVLVVLVGLAYLIWYVIKRRLGGADDLLSVSMGLVFVFSVVGGLWLLSSRYLLSGGGAIASGLIGGEGHLVGIMSLGSSLLNVTSLVGGGVGYLPIYETGYGVVLVQLGVFGLLFMLWVLSYPLWCGASRDVAGGTGEGWELVAGRSVMIGEMVAFLFHGYVLGTKVAVVVFGLLALVSVRAENIGHVLRRRVRKAGRRQRF